MYKTTQKSLREGVALNVYREYNGEELSNHTVEATSSGTYGVNGCLVRDNESGELYAIIGRSSDLFKFV